MHNLTVNLPGSGDPEKVANAIPRRINSQVNPDHSCVGADGSLAGDSRKIWC